MTKVAFIGLGIMGFPMAGHLQRAGNVVTVWNRTRAKAELWHQQHGGVVADTPGEAAKAAECVFTCVGNDADLRSVAYGDEGILAGLASGALLVDHTTASARIARELSEAATSQGAQFVDSPISGGQAGAENGTLTIMCGGEEAAFRRAKPIMQAYGRTVTLMGGAGTGQLTKMVNQVCIAGLLQALAEGVNFAQQAGLDTDQVLAVISKGAAQSWLMENRWKTMAERRFDFGFAVDWMRKDLAIALDEARLAGASLPVTAMVDQLYRLVQQRGGGRFDNSSLILNLGAEAKPPVGLG